MAAARVDGGQGPPCVSASQQPATMRALLHRISLVRARILAVLLVLGLAACQTAPVKPQPQPQPVPQPLPTLPPIPEPRPVLPTPLPPPPVSAPKTAEQISGAAVTSLMKQAREYRSAGQPAKAAGVLERALRIEPRNYFAWSALGQAYLEQKNYAQAESMALRSNALARGNVYAELENWKTIAAARQARGDSSGAAQAQTQIEMLQARLSAPPAAP